MSALGRDILVVEDDAEIRLFLKTSLVADGFTVFTAASGREARTMAANRPYDLFVVDLGLPDADGVDIVRSLRTRSQVPILILSAQTDERRKIEALDAGADDYVTKPFGIGELRARLRVAMRRAGEASARYEVDGLLLDIDHRKVQRDKGAQHVDKLPDGDGVRRGKAQLSGMRGRQKTAPPMPRCRNASSAPQPVHCHWRDR